MVWRMSLHHVPWMESEPVKKSTHTDVRLEDVKMIVSKGDPARDTCDVCGSGQGEDQGSVQLL